MQASRGAPTAAIVLRASLAAGSAARLGATGHSMTPFVRAGDVLTLEPLRGRRPRLGDVVAAASADGRLLVHRLVGWRRDEALTRGDIAERADPPVPVEALLGVVTRVERGQRRVRLGLGRERLAIALASRSGLLRALARLRERLRAPARG